MPILKILARSGWKNCINFICSILNNIPQFCYFLVLIIIFDRNSLKENENRWIFFMPIMRNISQSRFFMIFELFVNPSSFIYTYLLLYLNLFFLLCFYIVFVCKIPPHVILLAFKAPGMPVWCLCLFWFFYGLKTPLNFEIQSKPASIFLWTVG